MKIKIPIAFTVISLVAVVIDCFAGMLLIPVYSMFLGFYLSGENLYSARVLFILPSIIFIVSIVGLFTLTKWTRNIFVTITILLHCLLIVFCLVQPFLLKAMVLVAFLIIFVNYFLKASTRKLFNDQNSF